MRRQGCLPGSLLPTLASGAALMQVRLSLSTCSSGVAQRHEAFGRCVRGSGARSEGSDAAPSSQNAPQGCPPAGRVAWRLASALGEQAGSAVPPGALAAAAVGAAAPPPASSAAQLLRLHSMLRRSAFSSLATGAAHSQGKLLPSAVAPLRHAGLAAALGGPTPLLPSRAALPPASAALLRQVQPMSGARARAQGHKTGGVGGTAEPSASPFVGCERGFSTAGSTSSGGGGPRQDFQRWLDGMRQRGYRVTYDAASGSIQIEGQQGKLRLYVKQSRSPSGRSSRIHPNMWQLACGAGGTFLGYKAYGSTAAAGYFCAWMLVSVPWLVFFTGVSELLF